MTLPRLFIAWSFSADTSSPVEEFVGRARSAPLRQIGENPGVDGAVIVGKLLDSNDPKQGFDAQEERFCDMFEAGITNPSKVVRVALQDAASIAGILVTTKAVVGEKPAEAPAVGGQPGMSGMM